MLLVTHVHTAHIPTLQVYTDQLVQICICQRKHNTHHLKFARGTSIPLFRHAANEHLSFIISSLEIHRFKHIFAEMCSSLHVECLLLYEGRKGTSHDAVFTHSCMQSLILTHMQSAVFHACVVANNLNLFFPILLNMQVWIAHQDWK